ncbi:glycine cleavage system protein GcvH [Neoroseomonas oryzicola]|uniref:Glycine cleavage system H protein n=1 Tax=Neoroseomonas oryzicola TaxID=535904 RepID=A0A9X9WL35_9PROT|nr:glycine cleavage system protein GcvH [Neoroseomonas oryzicola]MBR0661045.1 glycine cleavage system protein GcvH [Neoroseomonas oryzicola]NKE18306.1 glycine cleavage system protein GcvH [Neoroseomonas oryzicola]
MSETKFTKDHEWVRLDGGVATVGITDHAQNALGDVVFVDLPEVGRVVVAGEPIAVVESVKAASDVYAPIAGKIVEVNAALSDNPGTINSAPTTDGWFFKIETSDPGALDGLMDEATYAAYVDDLA